MPLLRYVWPSCLLLIFGFTGWGSFSYYKLQKLRPLKLNIEESVAFFEEHIKNYTKQLEDYQEIISTFESQNEDLLNLVSRLQKAYDGYNIQHNISLLHVKLQKYTEENINLNHTLHAFLDKIKLLENSITNYEESSKHISKLIKKSESILKDVSYLDKEISMETYTSVDLLSSLAPKLFDEDHKTVSEAEYEEFINIVVYILFYPSNQSETLKKSLRKRYSYRDNFNKRDLVQLAYEISKESDFHFELPLSYTNI
jgi:prefoldin subunit 5